MLETRKQIERDYHNAKRATDTETVEHTDYVASQMKWYSITRESTDSLANWFSKNVPGKKVLDYGCGEGDFCMQMAKLNPESVTGIDIADQSVENATKNARKAGYTNVNFLEMDAEHTTFPNDSFDVIFEGGVLHHLDLNKAYAEMARLLKPSGKAVCVEALGHNILIHRYRKRTPNLRTPWEVEHILRKKDIELAKKYFGRVELTGFFHLASIAAVPFRNTPVFKIVLSCLEAVDRVLLKVPGLRWQAWQILFTLSEPKKNVK
jgi:ubiquinone/menaquinone biosynthesis C-methylase UbiE